MAFTFEKLDIWCKSKELVKDIYVIIDEIPSCEKFALKEQLRRSIISVPSNIAEGSGRPSSKERIRFIEIAYGSLMESFCQLILAAEIGYIHNDKITELRPRFEELARMLSGFRKSLMQ